MLHEHPRLLQKGLVLSQSPLVSVILPAYNERGRIGETLTRLSDVLGEMGVSYEIIVVDDGLDECDR